MAQPNQAERVDNGVALAPFDLLGCSIAHRIDRAPPLYGAHLYGAHYVKRYLLCADAVCWTGMGIGLAAVWTALGRSTLYPVGPESGA